LKDFNHILRAFDVRCESRNYRGVEILLRRALSTWMMEIIIIIIIFISQLNIK